MIQRKQAGEPPGSDSVETTLIPGADHFRKILWRTSSPMSRMGMFMFLAGAAVGSSGVSMYRVSAKNPGGGIGVPPADGAVPSSFRSVDGRNVTAACAGPRPKPVPPFKARVDLGDILRDEGLARGAELGVQRGRFSSGILSRWSNCREYLMVDLWAPLENYKDAANVGQARQDRNFEATMQNTNSSRHIRRVCRNYTSSCVNTVPDGHFDFIYVDARHDYKGVYEDLVSWWPKLREGGIYAGHDYVVQNDGPAQSGQDWTLNYDGTRDETGTVVKGAVDRFSREVCRQITVSYREKGWNSWAMRK